MDIERVKKFWIAGSDEDWRVALGLFSLTHYSHALFYCHLSLEKLLKAVVVQETKRQSLYSHDLLILARIGKIALSQDQEEQLNEIASFNIRARYDDVKYKFYKKATKTYTEEYMKITKKLRIWLKKNYLKK